MPTWKEILDFPAGVCITTVTITPEDAVGIRESAFSFRQEVQVFSGQRMSMQVNFLRQDPDKGSELEAFFLKLRGTAGRFRFFDPYHSQPMGQAIGNPVITSALAGEQTIQTSGWIPNVNFQLKPGDYIQLGENLHRVLDPVNSDANGEAILTLWPDLRETYEQGERVKLRNPTGLWRLTRPPSFDRSPGGQQHVTSMECVEVR